MADQKSDKKSVIKKELNKINSGEIILQWLTYAFWAWTVISATILSAVIFTNYIAKDIDSGEAGAYLLASLIVLLPISILCDKHYKKHEPAKKHGASGLVMIIHAVIFALASIAGIITAVFALVSITLTGNDSSGGKITLLTALVAAILFGLLLSRVINYQKTAKITKKYPVFMVLVGLILAIFASIGPINTYKITRDDRLITSNIMQVQDRIYSYLNDNSKLPEKLSDLETKGTVKKLIDKNLIKYTPNTKQPEEIKNSTTPNTSEDPKASAIYPYYQEGSKSYFYEMCVNYKRDSSNETTYPGVVEPAIYKTGGDQAETSSDYKTSYDYFNYKAGEKCYKIRVITYPNQPIGL